MTYSTHSQKDDKREETSAGIVAMNSDRQKDSVSNFPAPAGSAATCPQRIKTGGNDVSALVSKSKKAAQSLYTLLHAKVCFSLIMALRRKNLITSSANLVPLS